MRRSCAAALVLVALGAAAQGATPAPAGSSAAAAGAGPAEWRTYDLLVDFKNLPRPYTCNELWYRLQDRKRLKKHVLPS